MITMRRGRRRRTSAAWIAAQPSVPSACRPRTAATASSRYAATFTTTSCGCATSTSSSTAPQSRPTPLTAPRWCSSRSGRRAGNSRAAQETPAPPATGLCKNLTSIARLSARWITFQEIMARISPNISG